MRYFYGMKSLLIFLSDDKAKAQKLISVIWNEMCAFLLKMRAFHFEMHKTADFHSNLLVPWGFVTEGYQGRPMKCVHSK